MSRRFIIVDDDPINNMLCKHIIKKNIKDSEVKSFEFPDQALSFISSEYIVNNQPQPTILLLDINMPEINGWEFLEKFAAMSEYIHSQFTIYIVSSSVDSIDQKKAGENKFVKKFLSKPLNKEALEATAC